MRFTVWCPLDGAVEVSADDVTTVVVRSGSDVEVAFGCPICGRPIAVRAQVPPGLSGLLGAGWGDPQSRHPEAWVFGQADPTVSAVGPPAECGPVHIDAYIEYFRRELADADTVESMLTFMDTGASR